MKRLKKLNLDRITSRVMIQRIRLLVFNNVNETSELPRYAVRYRSATSISCEWGGGGIEIQFFDPPSIQSIGIK